MPRQANIVSFDAARRAASGTRAPRAGGGRILIGGDQSAIVSDKGAGAASATALRPAPSWYTASSRERAQDDESPFASERSGRIHRFSDDAAADDNDARLEEAMAQRERGPLGRLRADSAKRRRERTKERADRAYFRQYEAGKGPEPTGGPRAAVYKGEMGSTHKRSSRMQQQATTPPSSRRGRRGRAADGTPFYGRTWFMGLAATVLCLVFGAVTLYGPAQQLYVDIREKDRLAAEYAAVVERNEHIDSQVQALETDEGIEDMARTQLGWVRKGEHAVSVSGLDPKDPAEFRGNIVSEDIPLPDTWYSGILDPLFGVS